MYSEIPKYVVVSCRNFGTGNVGWRLREVELYCFAENYATAKKLVEDWNQYGYGSLSFMIKYENWLNKNGPSYDNRPFSEKRVLFNY